MCPPAEFALRSRQGRLHRLELAPPPPGRPDPERAVKEYSRPAAGKPPPAPSELRPPAVLLATVRHLLALAEEEDDEDDKKKEGAPAAAGRVSSWERGAFVADRLRAVRLDVTVQRLSGRPAAALLERALVYLLHAGHHHHQQQQRLEEAPAGFDAHLHRGHVQETFAALRRAYRQAEEEEEEEGGPPLPSQARFQALFLLYHLGSTEALWQTLQLPEEVRTSPELRTALAINGAFLERNFARFFRLARALPYLPSCALHQHLGSVRRLALMTFSSGFSARNCRYPLPRLARLLAMDDLEEAAELCRAHGLAVTEGSVVFQKSSFKDCSPRTARTDGLLVEGKREKVTLLELSEKICS
uniref:SAC3 domain-containing protein 1 n=1 Tax=Pogona vitticeps TaxID=103695 RepID=A0A6J0VAB4_9SAUR